MNRRQKVVVVIGVILVLLCGLFPPFEGECRLRGENLKAFVGYRFLFSPPSQDEVWSVIGGLAAADRYSSHIETQRVWLQFATVIIATVGLVVLLGDRPRNRSRVRDSAELEAPSGAVNEVKPHDGEGGT